MSTHDHVNPEDLPDQYIPTPQERAEMVKRGYKTIFGPQGPGSDYFKEKPWGPFLDLPAEIRLEIYRNMQILEPKLGAETTPHKHIRGILPFLGIYLSCRQIKHEMDHEFQKTIKKRFSGGIDALEEGSTVKGITVETPIGRPLDPILRIPSSFFEDDAYAHHIGSQGWNIYSAPIRENALLPLLDIPFNTLTIAPLEDIALLTPRVLHRWYRWLVLLVYTEGLKPHIKKGTLQLPEGFPKERSEYFKLFDSPFVV